MEVDLVRLGWGRENPAFRQVFTTMFFPEASPDQVGWFNDLQRMSASPENAARMMQQAQLIDVEEEAAKVQCPSLVLHATGDARVPFEAGRRLASVIPGARFVPLPSANHIPFEHEPAFEQFMDAVLDFTSR